MGQTNSQQSQSASQSIPSLSESKNQTYDAKNKNTNTGEYEKLFKTHVYGLVIKK